MEADNLGGTIFTQWAGILEADVVTYQGKPHILLDHQIVPIHADISSDLTKSTYYVYWKDRKYLIQQQHTATSTTNAEMQGNNGQHKSSSDLPINYSYGTLTSSTSSQMERTVNPIPNLFPQPLPSHTASDCPSVPCTWRAGDLKYHHWMTNAASSGRVEVMRLLRQQGSMIAEELGEEQEKLAFAAAKADQTHVLQYLCTEGVDLMAQEQADGCTLAHVAALRGNLELLDLIFSQAARRYPCTMAGDRHLQVDPNSMDETGGSSEHEDPTVRFSNFLSKRHEGVTASMIAASKGFLNVLKWLQSHGDATLCFKGRRRTSGGAFVKEAIRLEHLDMLKWLIESDISAVECNDDAEPIGNIAAQMGSVKVLNWLQNSGVSLRATDAIGANAMLSAASHGQLHVLQWMEYNMCIQLTDRTTLGRSAMHLAATSGNLQVMEWLTEHGSSLHERTYLGYTVACMAAKEGHVHVLQWLYQRGAPINQAVHDGTTPLLQAAFFGHLPVLKWMKRIGFSLHHYYKDGMGLAHIAARGGQLHVLQWLAAQGLSLIEPTLHGQSLVSIASLNTRPDVFQWLMEVLPPEEWRGKD